MKCPACGVEMIEKDFGGVMVDVCPGCKGLWFDWLELSKLDEKHEGAGGALAEALMSPRVNGADRGPLTCGQCGMKMQEHNFKRAQEVRVDECYGCGAFFLDSGELRMIRDNYMTDAEHAEFVESLVNSIPGLPEYQEDLERRFVRAKAMMEATKYVRASYIVPKMLGKTPPGEISIVLPGLIEKYRRDPSTVRTPELKALLEKYIAREEAERTPEQRAFIEVYGKGGR